MDRYFSLKLLKKETSFKKQRSIERSKSSNQDLIDQDNQYDHNEEARLAEEALAANLKLLKKQKARFMRLQKILSRNVILIPLCAIFSILSAVLIFSSTLLTDQFEHVTYDLNILKSKIDKENNITLNELNLFLNSQFSLNEILDREKFDNLLKSYFELLSPTTKSNNNLYENLNSNSMNQHNRIILYRNKQAKTKQYFSISILTTTLPSTTTQLNYVSAYNAIKNMYIYELTNTSSDYFVVMHRSILTYENSTNYIFDTYSSVWKSCNHLSDESRKQLGINACSLYRTNSEGLEDLADPARDVVRMHNAAACCAIVSYFLLVFSWLTALIAAVTKKVPLTLATCVLYLLIAVFLALLLAIFHRKILAEERETDCFDLKLLFSIVCQSRSVKFGYSLGLTWLALLFTSLSGFCWFHITKMQKLLFAHGFN